MFNPFRRKQVQQPERQPIRVKAPAYKRSFYGAKQDNLTFSFNGSNLSANEELKASLPRLRARSRQLYMDNDYVKKYFHMVKSNVIGSHGIRLQGRTKTDEGVPDVADNRMIEAKWADWGKPRNCTVTGKLSWLDVQRLFIETVARDGEVLVLMVHNYANPYGFALRIIESDYLDESLNADLNNGNRIIMGVEVDRWGKPIAYHLRAEHPGETTYMRGGRMYERVASQNVIHSFICERPEQMRGVPWLHTAIRRLNMLGGYEEAELVAARVSSSKMGFFKNQSAEYTGDAIDDEGNQITEVEPGVFENIGDNDFIPFDPQHPTTAFEAFMKTMLRGAAAGLNVAYEGLSNDREGVNYSSIRSGVIDERDQWRTLHRWVIEQLHTPIYEAWLNQSILTQAVPVPVRKTEKFHDVVWQPRGWQWVDPAKDATANKESIAMGVQTRAEIAASQGKDLDEIFDQLAIEQEMARQKGILIDPRGKLDETAND